MKKIFYTVLGISAVLVLSVAGFCALNQPPSIEYLRENPEAFRFEDYKNLQEISDTLRQLIPEGMAEEGVDSILLGIPNIQKYDVEILPEQLEHHHPGASKLVNFAYRPSSWFVKMRYELKGARMLQPFKGYTVMTSFDNNNKRLYLRVRRN